MKSKEDNEKNQPYRRFRNLCGKQIAKFRNEAKLTQEEFAAKIQLAGHDYDRATLAKIENQMRSLYDWELGIFAEVLGVNSLNDFYPSKKEFHDSIPALKKGQKAK